MLNFGDISFLHDVVNIEYGKGIEIKRIQPEKSGRKDTFSTNLNLYILSIYLFKDPQIQVLYLKKSKSSHKWVGYRRNDHEHPCLYYFIQVTLSY